MPISRVVLARLALVAYLPIAVALTIAPRSGGQIQPNLVPLAGIAATFHDGVGFGLLQLVGNLVLLLPLGALLPVAVPGTQLRHAIAAALTLSVAIELVQWREAAGRMADVDDVWLNALGAAVGHMLSSPWHRKR